MTTIKDHLDPARVRCHPALMQDAWFQLKAARGQPVTRLHLLMPAHVIRPVETAAERRERQAQEERDEIEAIRLRANARARRHIAAIHGTPGPDAA